MNDNRDDDDKVMNWMASEHRRGCERREHSGNPAVLLIVATILAFCMVYSWYEIKAMPHDNREAVLRCLATVFFFVSFSFPGLPRRFRFLVYEVGAFGVVVAAAYSGDMGADDHMFTGGMLGFSSLFSIIMAWLLLGRGHKLKEWFAWIFRR